MHNKNKIISSDPRKPYLVLPPSPIIAGQARYEWRDGTEVAGKVVSDNHDIVGKDRRAGEEAKNEMNPSHAQTYHVGLISGGCSTCSMLVPPSAYTMITQPHSQSLHIDPAPMARHVFQSELLLFELWRYKSRSIQVRQDVVAVVAQEERNTHEVEVITYSMRARHE